MRTRILLFLTGLILVPTASVVLILFVRGYRPDLKNKTLKPTGLLSATSDPVGAQVIINTELKTATDTTLNLPPGTYDVEIKKSGFNPWKKQLIIESEVVTQAFATLFPNIPSLKAITSSGAFLPTLSNDKTKVAFVSDQDNLSKLYILDLNESPLGLINRDPKLITTFITPPTSLAWSPDNKNLIASGSGYIQLVDLASESNKPISFELVDILTEWAKINETHLAQRNLQLPKIMQEIVASATANLVWSPKENKVLYTATASASLPINLGKNLPGSNSQTQERDLKPGSTYVYDLTEDRNFKLNYPAQTLAWFPNSYHLIKAEKGLVKIFEYDGTNETVLYAGPMKDATAFPYPSGKQLLILTDLNPGPTSKPNLYAVDLK